MSFSILILTHNEERNLAACLASLAWCDDVVVLDSHSIDRTREIATAHGARVFCRPFDNFGDQRNFALDTVAFQNPWVFHLDADEQFTDALRAECETCVGADCHSGYLAPSRLMFRGRWLKHAGCYPVYQMRLHKLGEVRFVAHGHGQREGLAQRGLGTLREPYLHFGFSKGLEDWFAKHVRYAAQEARMELAEAGCGWRQIVSRDAVVRRRALKRLSAQLPLRPLLRFVYLYLLRGGFLDGYPGFVYCRMLAAYEAMIVTLRQEMRQHRPAKHAKIA